MMDLGICGNYSQKTKLICVEANLTIFMLVQDKTYVIISCSRNHDAARRKVF
jgi:predicted nucleic-acid-binding Zn-ribbon protein